MRGTGERHRCVPLHPGKHGPRGQRPSEGGDRDGRPMGPQPSGLVPVKQSEGGLRPATHGPHYTLRATGRSLHGFVRARPRPLGSVSASGIHKPPRLRPWHCAPAAHPRHRHPTPPSGGPLSGPRPWHTAAPLPHPTQVWAGVRAGQAPSCRGLGRACCNERKCVLTIALFYTECFTDSGLTP